MGVASSYREHLAGRAFSLLCGLVLWIVPPASAQLVIERYQPTPGVLRIGYEADRVVEMTPKGFTLILPAGPEAPQGVVVFFDAHPPTIDGPTEPGTFGYEAAARRVAELHITTGNPLDFFFHDSTMADVARRIQEGLAANGLRHTPVYFAGLSLGGTRALKLAIFLKQHRDAFWLTPAAAAVVDAPLDMARLWRAERRAAEDAFHPAAADEGRWVTYLLETNFGGTPRHRYWRYAAYAPFTWSEPHGGNAVFLRDLPLRAYHEPDVGWWIEHRRKSYYSMNSIDLAALVNQLRLLGNAGAELVTTHARRKGYADGASPHTWTIVDNRDLIDWFLAQRTR